MYSRTLGAALAVILAVGPLVACPQTPGPQNPGSQTSGPGNPALATPELARVPVRIVEGKLVLPCDLSTKFRRLPVNLFVEYDTKCGLQLHNQAVNGLKAETASGQTFPITIHLGGYEITVPQREHGPEDDYNDFTKYHSVELDEKAVVGTIGAELLSQYLVVFDLAAGELRIGPPAPENSAAHDAVEGATVVPLTEVNDLAWLPVRHGDGSPGALAIGGSRYDTLVDADLCDRFDRPAGNLPTLLLGGVDLTEFIALRPAEVVQVHPDGVVGIAGLNLLRNFRVEIDRVNRVAKLWQTAPADYPEEDFAFFEALVQDESAPLAAYLERYPLQRLSREAAERLLDMRLDEDAEASECKAAIVCIHDTYPEDLRTTAMVDLMKTLVEAEHPAQAIMAGELGVESGRVDRYPNAVHEAHAKLGQLLLAGSEDKRAWRHLLSAAFGLPENGMVNLDLGRFYEKQGRLKRAYSRYIQAVIKPDSGPAALEALHRLQGEMSGDDRMSVDQIEKMVGGKVHGFGAATRFVPTSENTTNRVVLVEFLTNANLGDGSRGAIGGLLGNAGLISHFQSGHVAFLTYHLEEPEPVPLTNELAGYAADRYGPRPVVHVVNGVHRGPGAGRWRDKEAVYERCRALVNEAMLEPSDYELKLTATVADGRVRGEMTVEGPERQDVHVEILLVERSVLFPGRSEQVVHKNIARGTLTGSIDGVAYRPESGVMRVPFDVALDDVRVANERYLDKLEAADKGATMKLSMAIDPEQVRLVGVVRDVMSNEVLQACLFDPKSAEGSR